MRWRTSGKLLQIWNTDTVIIINLSGRGDKDIETIATMEGITL